MKKTSFLWVAVLLYPASAFAMGDPGIVYVLASAFALQLLGLLVCTRGTMRHWPIVAAAYVAFFACVWWWALDTKFLTVDTIGWLLNGLPLALILIRWAAMRQR